MPGALCQWCHAVPKVLCRGTGSLCESERGGAAAPSPLAPFPGAAHQNHFRNDWGSHPGPSLQRPALLSSPWPCAPQVAPAHAARSLLPRIAARAPTRLLPLGLAKSP